MGKEMPHSSFVRLGTRTPALGAMDTTPLRAVVAAHAATAVALTPEGANPSTVASAPPIGATAAAPAPLGSPPEFFLFLCELQVA